MHDLTNHPMQKAAERQATERAEREGVACYVYRCDGDAGSVWFVRTKAEGIPDGCETHTYCTEPPAGDGADPGNGPRGTEAAAELAHRQAQAQRLK